MPDVKRISRKIVLLGDPAVGKTSLIQKFVHNLFDDKYMSTLGTKVSSKILEFETVLPTGPVKLTLMIWDVMGQEDYAIFHQSACSGSRGALIVSDLTRNETIENIPKWVDKLYNATGSVPIIILGNKSDLSKETNVLNQVEEYAKATEVPFFFTSAKTGENVENAFSLLGENMLKFNYNEIKE